MLVSPLGDELVAGFARAAVIAEDLGQDAFPDYLSVSFSGLDAASHFFGPSSLENEEVLRRLDRTLADLFAFLDDEVGADKVLYVLSADHGMPEMPEYMAENGFATDRAFSEDIQDELNDVLARTLGLENAIKFFFRPYIYLDDDVIAASGADRRQVEQVIVDTLSARNGIAIAMPVQPLPGQRGDTLEGPIRRNFHPQRSGDIYVAQAPYSFLMAKSSIAAMHGSPWRFDTHVPIIFAGPGIEAARVSRKVGTVDVAATLSAIFGTTLPSGSAGNVLKEVMD